MAACMALLVEGCMPYAKVHRHCQAIIGSDHSDENFTFHGSV